MESALSNTADKSVRPKRKATERFQKMIKDNIDYLKYLLYSFWCKLGISILSISYKIIQ